MKARADDPDGTQGQTARQKAGLAVLIVARHWRAADWILSCEL